jgi:hypothetical protein
VISNEFFEQHRNIGFDGTENDLVELFSEEIII